MSLTMSFRPSGGLDEVLAKNRALLGMLEQQISASNRLVGLPETAARSGGAPQRAGRAGVVRSEERREFERNWDDQFNRKLRDLRARQSSYLYQPGRRFSPRGIAGDFTDIYNLSRGQFSIYSAQSAIDMAGDAASNLGWRGAASKITSAMKFAPIIGGAAMATGLIYEVGKNILESANKTASAAEKTDSSIKKLFPNLKNEALDKTVATIQQELSQQFRRAGKAEIPGSTGFLVREQAKKELVDQVNALVRNPELGAAALQTAMDDYRYKKRVGSSREEVLAAAMDFSAQEKSERNQDYKDLHIRVIALANQLLEAQIKAEADQKQMMESRSRTEPTWAAVQRMNDVVLAQAEREQLTKFNDWSPY